MRRRVRPSILVLAAAAAIGLTAASARAQTITNSVNKNPDRIVNGVDLGQSTRPPNLNPTGINYADCVDDMVLQYSVILSGFPGAADDSVEVWASIDQDCTQDTARGLGGTSAVQATCWLVNPGLPPTNVQTNVSYPFKVPVRALVGVSSDAIPPAGTVVGDQGLEACQKQATFAGETISVYFLPIQPNGYIDMAGMPYQAPAILADLVGPPAPVINPVGAGDTLFVLTWAPNNDADTVAYDVFIDPPLGSSAVSDASFNTVTKTLECPETGPSTAPTIVTDDAALSDEASLDGASSVDATTAPAVTSTTDGGCVPINQASSPAPTVASTCASTVLTSSSTVLDGGVAAIIEDSSVTTIEDDAGGLIVEDSGIESTTGGGISTIPCQYLVGASCTAGASAYTNTGNPTVTGEPNGRYVIKGLTNGQTYDVVVAAVDGSGNVGPASICMDDYPAPVIDFFKLYRQDGGQAGGSFCALEAVGQPAGASMVGVGFGAVALTMARRRRRSRRRLG